MKTRDQMTPAELEAAMEAYRRRNDQEEIRLRGAAGAKDIRGPVTPQIPLDAIRPEAAPLGDSVPALAARNAPGMLSPDAEPYEVETGYKKDLKPKSKEEQKKNKVDKALSVVLEHEGGFQANPNDSGNYTADGTLVGTNFGISAKAYEMITGEAPTQEKMESLTKEEAIEIYKKEYVPQVTDKLGVKEDNPVFTPMLDLVINLGIGNAIPVIQRAVGAKVDGKLGPKTRKAIKDADPEELVDKLTNERINYYIGLVKSKPSQMRFLKGWYDRAQSVKERV